MVAYTRASKGPHGEGAMESHDREESMASTIVHHHMEPSLGGDGALPKAKSDSTLVGYRETKSKRPPMQFKTYTIA